MPEPRALVALAAVLALGATRVAAQAPAPDPKLPPLGEPAALPEGAPPLLQRIDREDLRRHAYWLADDARAGRYTGSKSQLETAKYVADHWKQLGLEPLGDKRGYLQAYPIERVALDPASGLSFGSERVKEDFAVLTADDDTKIALAGKFAWCGNGTEEQSTGELARRLPVVVLSGLAGQGGGVTGDLQAVNRFRAIAKVLAGHGATAGIVCLTSADNALGNTLNYHGILPDHARLRFGNGGRGRDDFRVPLVILGPKPTAKLLAHLGVPVDAGGAPTGPPGTDAAAGKLQIALRTDEKSTANNVVAVLRGTKRKSEAVVVSAHHDHVGLRVDGDAFNGADDNASGTSGLLEIAEAFARSDKRPERSIVFLSVSGEELGLWGSAWFADHPTWPLDKITADVNIDMIGRAGGGDGGIAMQVTPSHDHEKYSTMVRDAVQRGRSFGIEFSSGDQYYARSDHYNFAQKGVPVVFFCDGEHPDYHKVTDSPDRLDYAKMEAVTRLAAWTAWEVANGQNKLQELGKQPAW